MKQLKNNAKDLKVLVGTISEIGSLYPELSKAVASGDVKFASPAISSDFDVGAKARASLSGRSAIPVPGKTGPKI